MKARVMMYMRLSREEQAGQENFESICGVKTVDIQLNKKKKKNKYKKKKSTIYKKCKK